MKYELLSFGSRGHMACMVHSDTVTQRSCNGSTFVFLRYCSSEKKKIREFLYHLMNAKSNPCRDICWCFLAGLILRRP